MVQRLDDIRQRRRAVNADAAQEIVKIMKESAENVNTKEKFLLFLKYQH